jgi:hypothetical protein
MAQQTTHEVGTDYNGPSAPRRLDHNSTFTVDVETISEARDAERNAEELGYELSHAAFHGSWRAQNRSGDHPREVFYGSDNVKPVLNLGRSWFLTIVDGHVERIRPGEGSSVRDDGYATLEFVTDRGD